VELIKLMDKEGIGTDATMAQHITTIQQRGYATCDPATLHFSATSLGMALLDGYDSVGKQVCCCR